MDREKSLIAKFVVSRSAICKLRRNLEFFCSVNHLSGPPRKHVYLWLVPFDPLCFFLCSWFAACDRPVSGNDRLVFFEAFYDLSYLVSCKNKAISASCPQQKFHSSSRFSSLFLSSLGSFSILFLRAKLGECVGLWFALTPPSLTWLTEQKNPLKVCKHAARYNEFGYKSDKELSKIPATYKPRKTVQKAHYIQRWDELCCVGLVVFVP